MENVLLKKQIMRRVHTIHILRQVVNVTTLKCSVLLVMVIGVVSVVSVTNVLTNMPDIFNVISIFYFSKYAFMNTEVVVQLLIVTMLGVSAWLLRDAVIYILTSLSRHKATPIIVKV